MRPAVTLLVVENDALHREVVRRALDHVGWPGPVLEAHDGEEGLACLHRLSADARPLVLSDLRMPRLDGIGLMRAMAEDPALRLVPVFVLTGSDRDKEVEACLAAGAAGLFCKNDGVEAITNVMRMLREYATYACLMPLGGSGRRRASPVREAREAVGHARLPGQAAKPDDHPAAARPGTKGQPAGAARRRKGP